MALYYNLPIYKDTYRLVLEVFALTQHFPREYKYTLGQELKSDALQLVRYVYKANSVVEKGIVLVEFTERFELLKLQLRLAFDLRLLPEKTVDMLKPLLLSIGRQLSGWRRQQATAGAAT